MASKAKRQRRVPRGKAEDSRKQILAERAQAVQSVRARIERALLERRLIEEHRRKSRIWFSNLLLRLFLWTYYIAFFLAGVAFMEAP